MTSTPDPLAEARAVLRALHATAAEAARRRSAVDYRAAHDIADLWSALRRSTEAEEAA